MATPLPQLNSRYEPAPRAGHRTILADGNVYMWAGAVDGLPRVHDSQEKRELLSFVEVFQVKTGNWIRQQTSGTPPLGVTYNACAVVSNALHYFGGYCYHDDCYHNSLHSLNTMTLHWVELSPTKSELGGAPMRKNRCGMVPFKDEEDFLYVVAGQGPTPAYHQPGAQYKAVNNNFTAFNCNEQHMFSLSKREWSSPSIIGEPPCPCDSFTLTLVGERRAALFGGMSGSGSYCDDLLIVELSSDTVRWTRINHSMTWPEGRYAHTTVCVSGPLLVIVGGRRSGLDTISDCWIGDLTTEQWKKLSEECDYVTKRVRHSLSAIQLSPERVLLVVFGGRRQSVSRDKLSHTALVELILQNGQWVKGRILKGAALDYKEVYQQMMTQNNDLVDPDDARSSLGITVIMNIINIGTQGYPGTGKTSTLDLAMGKEPAHERNSTGCVDPPSRYMLIDNEDSTQLEWENVTTERMFEMVCGAVKKTIEESSSDKATRSLHLAGEGKPATRTVAIGSNEPLPANDTTPVGNEMAPVPTTAAGSTNQTPAKPFLDLSPYDGFSLFPDLLKKLHSSRSSGVIFNSHWMIMTDCGGQPPFLDAGALFLRNSCLQIFPLKLNEPLNKLAEFSYFFHGMSANCEQFGVQLSNVQIMKTLAKHTASIQPPYTPSAIECPSGAKFTVVGTFADEAHVCSETVAEKESILKEILQPYAEFQVQLGSKVILPINAVAIDTETRKERTESAKKLRRLFKISNVTMKVEVKLRWFGFLLSMLTIAEKDDKAILTLSECFRLGESLEMDKAETKKAIQFFHDISLIMHFDTPKLRDSVIIDTKPVFNKLSRLITISFLDEDFLAMHYDDINLPIQDKKLLQHRGCLTRKTLESCVDFSEPISSQFFLDILEHVKIVAKIDQTSEYFMPCALPYATKIAHSFQFPWMIRLRARRGIYQEYVPIPVGYLPTILVFLLTVFPNKFVQIQKHERQYRNMIKLHYVPGGVVCLVERHLQIEVYYSGIKLKQLQQQCSTIRDCILESIRLTEVKLHIRKDAFTKVDSFLCSCGEESACHICTFNPETCIVECEETREVFKLKAHHQQWLGAATVTGTSYQLQGTPPTLLKLMEMKGADGKPLSVIETITASNYKKFGIHLLRDANGARVDLIEKNHISKGADRENVTLAILQKWLESDAPTRTYQHLIECLRQTGLRALAELIANATEESELLEIPRKPEIL